MSARGQRERYFGRTTGEEAVEDEVGDDGVRDNEGSGSCARRDKTVKPKFIELALVSFS